MRNRRLRWLFAGLAVVVAISTSGCITFTPHYSLVDLNRPHGLLDSARPGSRESAMVAVAAVSLTLVPLGWLLYRRRHARALPAPTNVAATEGVGNAPAAVDERAPADTPISTTE
jgi:hypothetical protein